MIGRAALSGGAGGVWAQVEDAATTSASAAVTIVIHAPDRGACVHRGDRRGVVLYIPLFAGQYASTPRSIVSSGEAFTRCFTPSDYNSPSRMSPDAVETSSSLLPSPSRPLISRRECFCTFSPTST